MGNRQKGVLCVLAAAALWGLLPLISRILAGYGSTAIPTAAMRCYLAALIYLIMLLVGRSWPKLSKRGWAFYTLYGLCSVVGTYVFYALAIERLSTAAASVLLYTAPAFVILFSRLLFHAPITKEKAVALLLTFAGCFLVVRGYDVQSLKLDALGILYGVLSGLSYSSLSILGCYVVGRYDAKTNSAMTTILAAVIFLFLCPPWTIPVGDPWMWVWFLLLAVVGSVLPYLLYLKGMELGIDGGSASIISALEPIVAAATGVLLLHETMEGWQALGMALTIAGIIIPIAMQKTQQAKEPGGEP